MTNANNTIKTYKAVITYRVAEGSEDFILDAIQRGMDFEEEEGIVEANIDEVKTESSDDFSGDRDDASYCGECGKDFEWFMHNCARSIEYNEVHGCPTCDDHCDLC